VQCPKCDHEFGGDATLLAAIEAVIETYLADFVDKFNKHTNATGTGPSSPIVVPESEDK
jgi:hypothetical protein